MLKVHFEDISRGLLTCLAVVASTAVLCGNLARAQNSETRPPDSLQTYRAFLLGNTEAGERSLKPTLQLLRQQFDTVGEDAVIVFLGDQLPQGGLPPARHPDRASAQRRLQTLIEAVDGFAGKVFFIPGDLDHGPEGAERVAALKRQETFLEAALGPGNVFLPNDGFPGPQEVQLKGDIRLVALNTDWLLQTDPSPASQANGFTAEEAADVYSELSDLIKHRHGDDLLFVGHHPIFSNGRYGGHLPPYYLLPVIGTAVHGAKRFGGGPQYFSHRRNEWMRDAMFTLLMEHEDFIYASAHDHGLQYFQSQRFNWSQSFVVSGAAAKSEHTAQRHEPDFFNTEFAAGKRGFVTIDYYRDGSIWMDAWHARDDGTGHRFSERMVRRPMMNVVDVSQIERSSGGFTGKAVITPNAGYKAGLFRRWFLGSNHRDVWTIPTEVPVLNLGTEQGGLMPIKRGGGMQTTSVRFENSEGRQFVLRTINKDGRFALPKPWQPTFIGPIVNDLLSMSHPYSVLPIPPLADAVGIYHANPRIVLVPDDPLLGSFRSLIGDQLAILEERPNKDMSHAASFGNSTDVVGWSEMYRNVTRDNDDRVDDRFMLRNRIFDMWLSDWDRHRDQWRWATFADPDGDGKIYRPVPRDRDNAFMVLNPFVGFIVKPFIKFQDFRRSYGSVKGLGENGRLQDHRFLGRLSRQDWLEIADSVQAALTDDVIERALRRWPEEIYEEHGDDMLETAKVRRDKIPEVADKMYGLHARSVDVIGSDKHEKFEIHRRPDGDTEVVMYKTSREGETRQELYRRVLHKSETREINLFGLGGDDTFVVTGKTGKGIRLNAVGGSGHDTFVDSSRVGRTHFYDTRSVANTFHPGPKTTIHRSDDPDDNHYTNTFSFERLYPLPLVLFNSDDGLIFSGSALWLNHAFQKQPYARQDLLSVRFAAGSRAFSGSYKTTVTDALGDWDVGFDLDLQSPNNITRFYGLGNETSREESDPFETGLAQVLLSVPFTNRDEMGLEVSIAPLFAAFNVDDDRVSELLALQQPGLSVPTGRMQSYAGLRSEVELAYTDDPDNPRHGYVWAANLDARVGLLNAPDPYATVASSVALYVSLPTSWQATLAARVGGAHNFGTFPFFGSNMLGSKTNLRGFRSTRFAGRSTAFVNADVRLQLFQIRRTFLPGRFGVLGFVDHGRVWTDNESSDTWHRGYGFGVWYNIVDEIVINFTHGESNEDTFDAFGFSFFF